MTAEQMETCGREMERLGEELVANGHALILQAREIQRRAQVRVPLPDGPEVNA